MSFRQPVNDTAPGPNNQIWIRQRYSWRRSFWPAGSQCTSASINAQTPIANGMGLLNCSVGISCGSWTTISADVPCTDFSPTSDHSSGERYDLLILPINTVSTVGFSGNAWPVLAGGGNGSWQLTTGINLNVRPDMILNTSPVAATLPIVYRPIGIPSTYTVSVSDMNSLDVMRCRWSTNNSAMNSNGFDECGSICPSTLPSSVVLNGTTCSLTFTLTSTLSYGVAMQIEDFYNSSSTMPMSSVPVQFLLRGVTPPGGCGSPPHGHGQSAWLWFVQFCVFLSYDIFPFFSSLHWYTRR